MSLNWLRNVEKFLQLSKEFELEGGQLFAFAKNNRVLSWRNRKKGKMRDLKEKTKRKKRDY